MNNLIKIWSIAGLSAGLFLIGCTGNNAAEKTADAMLSSMFESAADSEEQLEMLKSMPEYEQSLTCLVTHLDREGWTQAQHDFYMEETNGTGSLEMINSRKFSDAEAIKHFGPLLTSNCV